MLFVSHKPPVQVAIVLEDGRFAGDRLLPVETQFDELSDALILAIDVPIGFGLTGERSENVPCTLPLLAGLWSTRSRRERSSQ